MSQTELGETVGSVQELGSEQMDTLYKMSVGGKPVAMVKFGGISLKALLDTGSQVSTVSETFYEKHLSPGDNPYYEGKLFRLTCANRLEIPYIGIVLVDIEIRGKLIDNIGVLVVKDTELTKESRVEVPGIVGMNCLMKLPQLVSILTQEGATCHKMDLNHKETKSRIVKISGKTGTIVPAASIVKVSVFSPSELEGPLLVEPLSHSPKGVTLTPIVVNVKKGECFQIPVINFTDKDVVLSSGT
jgi:hypothetical protein